MSILAYGNSGFWMDICREQLPDSRLLAQDNMEILRELIEASSLPAFSSNHALSSNRVIMQTCRPVRRVILPIQDKAAYTTYYLACLASEQAKYQSVFHAIPSELPQE